MLVEYWLAGFLGRAWLRLRKSTRLQPGGADMPGLCAAVGRGTVLPAGQLWSAQDFAVRVWWRLSFAAGVLMVAIGLIAKEASHGAVPGAVLVIVVVLLFVMAAAVAQVLTIRYRSDRIRLYLRKADAAAGVQPLPPDARGTPQRSDFWVTLVVTLAITGSLFYWRMHSPR